MSKVLLLSLCHALHYSAGNLTGSILIHSIHQIFSGVYNNALIKMYWEVVGKQVRLYMAGWLVIFVPTKYTK